MIGIFSKGLRANRSGSPVMMQSALPERASSRYLSSSGSRQIVTRWETSIFLLWLAKRRRKKSLSYSFLKYLSNFFLFRTFENSRVDDVDRITVPFKNAFLTARKETELFIIAALMRTFASITTVIRYFFSISFKISSVMPCFRAYSLMSSITSNNVLLSFNSLDKVSRANCFSCSVSLSNFEASSSLTDIVFIKAIQVIKYNEMKTKLV